MKMYHIQKLQKQYQSTVIFQQLLSTRFKKSVTFVSNIPFGSILKVSQTNFIFLKKTFNSEFSYIKLWFKDQNSQQLEIKDKTNLILVIK